MLCKHHQCTNHHMSFWIRFQGMVISYNYNINFKTRPCLSQFNRNEWINMVGSLSTKSRMTMFSVVHLRINKSCNTIDEQKMINSIIVFENNVIWLSLLLWFGVMVTIIITILEKKLWILTHLSLTSWFWFSKN